MQWHGIVVTCGGVVEAATRCPGLWSDNAGRQANLMCSASPAVVLWLTRPDQHTNTDSHAVPMVCRLCALT